MVMVVTSFLLGCHEVVGCQVASLTGSKFSLPHPVSFSLTLVNSNNGNPPFDHVYFKEEIFIFSLLITYFFGLICSGFAT